MIIYLEKLRDDENKKDTRINRTIGLWRWSFCVWLPLTHPQLGTWPTTQACALTGSQTRGLVLRRALNPQSHVSQGWRWILKHAKTKKCSLLNVEMGKSIEFIIATNIMKCLDLNLTRHRTYV